jgi:hypothetical protein
MEVVADALRGAYCAQRDEPCAPWAELRTGQRARWVELADAPVAAWLLLRAPRD